MSKINKRIAKRLNELFLQTGWSQELFGKKIGTSQAQVYNYLKGIQIPRIERLEKIADVFGITLIDFLTEESPSYKKQEIDIYDALDVVSNFIEQSSPYGKRDSVDAKSLRKQKMNEVVDEHH